MDEFIREESRLKEWSLETPKMVKSFKNHLLKFKKTAGLDFYDRRGLYALEVAKYRSGEMQVVSGPMGHEKVHYEAPKPQRIPEEMHRFIDWVNTDTGTDPVLKGCLPAANILQSASTACPMK